jgi:S1-C subfamily serine protease
MHMNTSFNLTFIKTIVLAFVVCFLSACVSMNGKMQNAQGELADCSTSGGGIGLGMVVGAATAAISNSSCESKMREKGFLLTKDVGKHGVGFGSNTEPVVSDVSEPASSCVSVGDKLTSVNGKPVASALDAKRGLFAKSGDKMSLAMQGTAGDKSCNFTLK